MRFDANASGDDAPHSDRADRTIGFIGLGNMGRNMASHLRASGYTVLGYDINDGVAAEFAAESKTRQPELADLANASIIWSMLPTGDVVRKVLLGDPSADGVLAAGLASQLRPGTLVIDTTSSPPESTRRLGSELSAHGIRMIDAGVSGGHRGAVAGDLVFMIGGNEDDIERALVPMRTMSERMFVMGPLGSGHTMKAINNAVSAACFVASCEGLLLGENLGVDPAALVDVLNVSTGRNDASERSLPKILDRSFRRTFSLALFTKDVKIARDMAEAGGVAAPVVDLVHERMADALAELGNRVDHTAAYQIWSREAHRA